MIEPNLSLPPELQALLAQRESQHKSLVLVTGVFDILHEQHKELLRRSKKLGDFLVVGVESDVRVKQMKGEDRPYNPQATRLANLRELQLADFVFLLPENFGDPAVREALIAQLHPDILALSAHSQHLANKVQLLAKYGGHVEVVLPYDPAFSSTQLIAAARQKQVE